MIIDEIREEKMRKRQETLFKLLPNDYYHKYEIIALLRLPNEYVEILTKRLTLYPGKGYKKLDIILKLSGGVLFEE